LGGTVLAVELRLLVRGLHNDSCGAHSAFYAPQWSLLRMGALLASVEQKAGGRAAGPRCLCEPVANCDRFPAAFFVRCNVVAILRPQAVQGGGETALAGVGPGGGGVWGGEDGLHWGALPQAPYPVRRGPIQ